MGIISVDGVTIWFDHLEIIKVCSDTPNLKLVVETSTTTPKTNLVHGMKDPLTEMGISSMSIELGESGSLASRWSGDIPELVAFFLPLSYHEIEGNSLSKDIVFKLILPYR